MSTIASAEMFHLPTWNPAEPFLLSDAECAALCRGDLVRWRGTMNDFLKLPFRCEMLDGWMLLKRRD